jgi:hypothetical protein
LGSALDATKLFGRIRRFVHTASAAAQFFMAMTMFGETFWR